MKKSILFAVLMMSSALLWSQLEINLEINFSHFQREYQPLEEYVNLTEDNEYWYSSGAEEDEIIFDIATPLQMPGFEDWPLVEIEVGAHPSLFIESEYFSDDPYSVFLEAVGVDAFILSPLNDSSNSDRGNILFFEGDGVLKKEFQNFAFERELNLGGGNLVSRANLQIELDYENLCVEFHYGPSTISSDLEGYFENNVIIGSVFGWFYEEVIGAEWIEDWLYLVGLVSGDPSNPEFNLIYEDPDFDEELEYLNSYPEEGTVYRFCYMETTSVDELLSVEHSLTFYPNPASDFIQIKNETEAEIRELIIFDQTGRVVMRTRDSGNIDVSSLPSGMYFVGARYAGAEHFQYGKLVKE